jgi:hypothetical protein
MQKNFIATFFILLLSLGILGITLLNLDPEGPQWHVAWGAFLVSVFTGTTAFFTFAIFFAVELFTGFTAGTKVFALSLRRATLIGLLFSLSFLLHFLNLFGTIEFTLLATFLALVEFFFMSYYK